MVVNFHCWHSPGESSPAVQEASVEALLGLYVERGLHLKKLHYQLQALNPIWKGIVFY